MLKDKIPGFDDPEMTLYVDRLDIVSCLSLLASPLFWRCRQLRCLQGNRYFSFLLRLLKSGVSDFSLEEIRISVGDTFDESGRCIRYQLEETVQELIDNKARLKELPFFRSFPFHGLPTIWVSRYFCQSLHRPVYLTLKNITLLSLARNDLDHKRSPILIRFGHYFDLNPDMPGDHSRAIVPYAKWLVRLASIIFPFITVFGISSLALIHFLNRISHPRGQKKSSSAAPSILVQYCWGHDRHGRSDVYFLDGGHVSPESIIYYFNRPDSQLTEDIRSDLIKRGITRFVRPQRIFSFHTFFQHIRRPSVIFRKSADPFRQFNWRPPLILAWEMIYCTIKILIASLSKENMLAMPLTIRSFLLLESMLFFYQFHYWRHFMLESNALIHNNNTDDCDPRHAIHSLAMHVIGGINVRSNYSYISIPTITSSREFHVYFSWGPRPRCTESTEEFHCNYICIAGYIFDCIFNNAHEDTRVPSLHSETVDFVISVFDETFSTECNYSFSTVNAFYQSVFDLLAELPQLGIIIKPKTYSIHNLNALFSGFAAANATGRVRVIDSSLRPATAAAKSDMSVSLGINSAGVEVALSGKPTIFLKHDDFFCPQLEAHGGGRLFARSIRELQQVIRDCANGAAKPEDYRFPPMVLQAIDPFRDGRAGERIGFYFSMFLREYTKTASREESLRRCAAAYADTYGPGLIARSMEFETEKGEPG